MNLGELGPVHVCCGAWPDHRYTCPERVRPATEGDKVTVGGVVSYEHPGNDWVEVRFAEGADGTAIVPRGAIIDWTGASAPSAASR